MEINEIFEDIIHANAIAKSRGFYGMYSIEFGQDVFTGEITTYIKDTGSLVKSFDCPGDALQYLIQLVQDL